ncbi:sugar hydrolase [Purpureocillium lavendulum]|uniref:Sugar hydrolase n=1 Tax=Purpureocillium lavendulum TaxID=1247861 RepID=A0AB34FBU4_9HYPO|nr:sugar hydrolase [Purpureocillium lavendulum]
MAKHTSKQVKHLHTQCTAYRKLYEANTSRQPLINTKLDSVSKASKDALDRQVAIAIFVSGKTYSLYEEPETLKLFQMLNAAYKPPDGNRIASFLEPVYVDYRQRVKALLDDAPHLNIIFDASDDISSNRIINVAVEIPNSVAFYWTTFDTKDHDHRALATLSLVRPAIVDIFGHDFSRLNAICTDTCSTMRKLHREMKALPEFSHCLYVLCDSHGLQLLVKDIVESKRWMPTFGKVTYLIGFFKKAKLQLSRLRIHQQECYGRRKAFITAAITRWGTQLAAVRSLLDNKDALRAFARDPATLNGLKQPIVKEEEHETQSSLSQAISYINDIEFWADVEMLFKVLEPIGRAQVSSERDRAGLGEVIPRWLSIQAAWDALEEAGQDPLINYQELKVLRKQRFDVQTDDIHYMAFTLDPATTEPKHKFLTTGIVRRAHNFLEENTNAEEYGNLFREFCQFRAREGSLFGPGSRIHRAECDDAPHHQHVLDSWRYLHSMNVSLAALAKRVLGALANSVPSERSFSSINFLHNKIRNRLTVTSTNKLAFIYMNSRVLRRLEAARETSWRIPSGQSWETVDVQKLLELDDVQDCIFVAAGTDAEAASTIHVMCR